MTQLSEVPRSNPPMGSVRSLANRRVAAISRGMDERSIVSRGQRRGRIASERGAEIITFAKEVE